MNTKKTFAVRLSDHQLKELKKIALLENRSVASVIRIIIDEYLEKRMRNK
jgi:hypothetical protein